MDCIENKRLGTVESWIKPKGDFLEAIKTEEVVIFWTVMRRPSPCLEKDLVLEQCQDIEKEDDRQRLGRITQKRGGPD